MFLEAGWSVSGRCPGCLAVNFCAQAAGTVRVTSLPSTRNGRSRSFMLQNIMILAHFTSTSSLEPLVALGASWVPLGCLLGASWVPSGCLLGVWCLPTDNSRCVQMAPDAFRCFQMYICIYTHEHTLSPQGGSWDLPGKAMS